MVAVIDCSIRERGRVYSLMKTCVRTLSSNWQIHIHAHINTLTIRYSLMMVQQPQSWQRAGLVVECQHQKLAVSCEGSSERQRCDDLPVAATACNDKTRHDECITDSLTGLCQAIQPRSMLWIVSA